MIKTSPCLVLLALTATASAQPAAPDRPGFLPKGPPPGIAVRIPSAAAGDRGIAARVLVPARPRYKEGAPVVVHVSGGVNAGAPFGKPEGAGLGFVEIFFAFPGGGAGGESSGGTYDWRGPDCHRALADVIRFATGRIADISGRRLKDLTGAIAPLAGNVGLLGSSHGGNASVLAMARHGEEFPDLAFYASMESPFGQGAVSVELGGHTSGVNPAYDPATGRLDLSKLAWSPTLAPGAFARRMPYPMETAAQGALFFDIDGDGAWSPEKDFSLGGLVCDIGEGTKVYYSPRAIREADRRALWGNSRPAHIPTEAQSTAFWRQRDASSSISDAVKRCPRTAVIVYAGVRDHVQAAPDHPHIIEQVEGFRRAGAAFIRLNPDRAYAARLAAALPGRDPSAFADADAGIEISRCNIRGFLEPESAPISLFMQAAIAELADRAQSGNRAANLDAVLFPDAPFEALPEKTPGPRRNAPRQGATAPPGGPDSRTPPASNPPTGGTPRTVRVDAGVTNGTIRSLLGTNRGPVAFPREPGEPVRDYTASYRNMGIDFIRTHDFYGPADWHVLFPRWAADPQDPASYDFASSDQRIRAICDNGFGCLYRLGTSWRGRNPRPINDPPGTIRGADGTVAHAADRDDFKKWAAICVQTVRHYTDGWNSGFRFPITQWEIWNEPDLAREFWSGTPEQYRAMYEEAAKALKAFNPKLKVGGPACTEALRPAYVEDFIRYCRDHRAPLDFFSWHGYGGREAFNPRNHYRNALRIRRALDENGFNATELMLTEWNAGIGPVLFADSARGAAFCASTLAALLDAGVVRAFQYCGDAHPGLGLHDRDTGRTQVCATAFTAWKHLLETPLRVPATGGDDQGFAAVAGRDSDGRSLTILVSNFQSGLNSLELVASNLPWAEDTPFDFRLFLVDETRRLDEIAAGEARGRDFHHSLPFRPPAILLAELKRR